jgi:hypothetical protein
VRSTIAERPCYPLSGPTSGPKERARVSVMSDVRQVANSADFSGVRSRGVGYVINTKGPASEWWTPVAILHDAGCGALRTAEADYKLFAERYYAAVDWLKRERPDNWESCGRCVPRPSRAETQAVREKRAVAFLVNNKSAWGGMTRLHTVTCPAAAKSQQLDEFSDYQSAVAWLNSKVGREGVSWSPCGICRPRPPRSGAPAGRLAGAYFVNDKSTYGVTSVVHEAGCRAAAMASGGLKPFPDFETAAIWLRAHVGSEGSAWKRCGICQPGPSSFISTPTRFAPASVSPTPTQTSAGQTPVRSVPTTSLPTPLGAEHASALQDVVRLTREVAELRQQIDAADKRAKEAEARTAARAGTKTIAPQISALSREVAELRRQRDVAVKRAEEAEFRGEAAGTAAQAVRQDLEEIRGGLQKQIEEALAAFELVANERDELRKSLAKREAALAAAEVHANEAAAEVSNLRGRVGTGDDRAYAELSVVSVADALMSEGLLRGTLGLRALDDMQVAAPSNTTLLEYRAIVLSDNRSDAEALATFDKLGEPRTARGRGAYVISAFRIERPVPRDEWIGEVDWQEQDAAPLLRGGLAKMPVGRVIGVLRALQGLLRPTLLRELLTDQYEREPIDSELMLLLDFWEASDPVGAAARICATARQRPLIGGVWLDEALDRIAQRQPDDDEAPRIIAARLAGMEGEAAANRALEVASWLRGVVSPRFRLEAARVIFTGRESPHLRDLLVGLLDGVPARLADAGAAAESQRAEKLLRSLGQSEGETGVPGANLNLVPVENAVAVLRAIEQKYPALVVLPQAFESASRWGRPNVTKLTKTLEELGSAAQRYRNNPTLDGYRELEKVPCKFARNVSATALQQYRSDYFLTDPDGQEVQLGPHFIVGSRDNVCRIYLAVDKHRRRYIVGHVGDHLRDGSHS